MSVADAIDRRALIQARHRLTQVVGHQATAISRFLGFAWTPAADAPSTYEALRETYTNCCEQRRPLPVSGLHCEDVIFRSRAGYHAMRFWHDVTHVRLDADFTVDGEMTVAVAHLDVVRAWGFGPETVEHKLLHADTIGQLYFSLVAGTFPPDQLRFAHACIEFGTAEAIEQERGALTPSGDAA